MATVQRKFDAGAVLRSLYEELAYVKKVAYAIDDDSLTITVRVVFDNDNVSNDDYHARCMTTVQNALEFMHRLPDNMKDLYHLVPLSGPPTQAGMEHFGRMIVVIDRQ